MTDEVLDAEFETERCVEPFGQKQLSNIQEFGCTDIARCTLRILAAVDRHSLPVVDKDGARISARGYAEGCWELCL